MIKKSGNLIVLSGPSGTGKSTLVNIVRQKLGNLEFSVSCTTRSPRPGEENGKAYYFISPEEFEAKVQNGEFIEYAGVFAHRYGTLRSEVVSRLEAGKDVLLDIDVQGAKQIRQAALKDKTLASSAQFIMIVPPSLGSLEKRLRNRNSETEEQLALRLAGAAGELANFRIYDYIVVNDDLETAADELYALLKSLRLRSVLIQDEEFYNDK